MSPSSRMSCGNSTAPSGGRSTYRSAALRTFLGTVEASTSLSEIIAPCWWVSKCGCATAHNYRFETRMNAAETWDNLSWEHGARTYCVRKHSAFCAPEGSAWCRRGEFRTLQRIEARFCINLWRFHLQTYAAVACRSGLGPSKALLGHLRRLPRQQCSLTENGRCSS
jgi:hypothetical protein